jgi:hypothetical protein
VYSYIAFFKTRADDGHAFKVFNVFDPQGNIIASCDVENNAVFIVKALNGYDELFKKFEALAKSSKYIDQRLDVIIERLTRILPLKKSSSDES